MPVPKQVLELSERALHAFDTKFPSEREFLKIKTRVTAKRLAESGGGWGSADNFAIRKQVSEFLELRIKTVCESFQRALENTGAEWYPQLADDLTNQLRMWSTPVLHKAEAFMEKLRRDTHSPRAGTTFDVKTDYHAALTNANAEIGFICAAHESNHKRKNLPQVPSVSYTIHGDNSRVNIGSHDYSINVSDSAKIFSELRSVIETKVADQNTRSELLKKAQHLEQERGTPTFPKRYTEFIDAAANHMTLLGPFVPALTRFLQT